MFSLKFFLLGLFLGSSLIGSLVLFFPPRPEKLLPTPSMSNYPTNIPAPPHPEINLLEESASPQTSASSTWWLNSGAQALLSPGQIKTLSGRLPLESPWREKYSQSNPTDTANGFQPQNIFRLVYRHQYRAYSQQVYFRLIDYHLDPSPNRNESNGVLLFNLYQDGDNLYYSGLRVDGRFIIKKKLSGTYSTLNIKKYFPGTYNRETSPNLLPINQLIGLKSRVEILGSQTAIQLFADLDGSGNWQLMLSAVDTAQPITKAGFVGLRSDFMDVEFENYSVSTL